MSTIMVGHRRIQIRAILLVAVVFVLILIFTASSTSLHEKFPAWKPTIPGKGTPASSETAKPDSNYPTFDSSYDNIDKVNPAAGAAKDPCLDVELHQGGTEPQKVDGTKVLVTGGAGFIGSNLVDTLLKLGYKVRVFDSLYTGFIRNVPLDDDRVEYVFGDIMNTTVLEEAIKGVDFVYHLAAMSKVVPSLKSPEMAKFCVEVNAIGTWNVLNAAREKGSIKKVIYAASSTYYGNKPPPHDEDMAPDFLTPYAASKYEGELQMQMFDRLFKVPTISTRFFMVYGPRQPSTGAYAIVTGVFAKQAADGKQLTIEGDGSHYRDFIHVSDIVNGLILSQQSADLHGNVVNLGTGTKFTVQDVANLVSKDQKHVDARPNDLEGTLADTCRMKKLLNYRAKADFTTEMSYMVKQTMDGNVFPQKWLTPLHAISAPHILAPGTPVFNWPKEQDNLQKLLDAIKAVKTGVSTSEKTITIIPLTVGNTDRWLLGDILINTIFSLVRFGGVTSYFVAAGDKAGLELCIELNAPCFDAQKPNQVELLSKLVGDNYQVHIAQLGNSYISPVQPFAEKLVSQNQKIDVFQAAPHGDVIVRATEDSKSAIAAWASENPTVSMVDLLAQTTWADKVKSRKSFTIPTLCKGKLSSGSGSLTPSSAEADSAADTDSAPSKASAAEGAQATSSLFGGLGGGKRSPPPGTPNDLCNGNAFYVPVDCMGENTKVTSAESKDIRRELEHAGLWHMTKCEDDLHCDHQQTVPKLWVQSKPDLKTSGGVC